MLMVHNYIFHRFTDLDEHAGKAEGVDDTKTEASNSTHVICWPQKECEIVNVDKHDSKEQEESEYRGATLDRVEDEEVDKHEEGHQDAYDGEDSQYDAPELAEVAVEVG